MSCGSQIRSLGRFRVLERGLLHQVGYRRDRADGRNDGNYNPLQTVSVPQDEKTHKDGKAKNAENPGQEKSGGYDKHKSAYKTHQIPLV